jgi:RecQ family ATP-dependent DNA helicase
MDQHLKKVYGFNKFRPYQKEIITDIISGENVSAILPTGGGKSMLYQFPATFLNKITLVVSPLISLMNDQCMALEAKGIKCAVLNGLVESCLKRKNCKCSICSIYNNELDVSLIYTTPEWLSKKARDLERIVDKICVIAIDEAHCISQWSHDFRPAYQQIAFITSIFKTVPILIVTATATPIVMEDIYKIMDIDSIVEYSLGTRRENLAISVSDNKDNWFTDIKTDENTIIYTQTRKETEKLYGILSDRNINCMYYHAGMSQEQREATHLSFLQGDVKVIVATISFGMGIDKSDIRHVINYGVPTDIETYYQEIGRAGRDGLCCRATIYYNTKDFGMASFLIKKGSTSQIKKRTESLNLFRQYLSETEICRQQMIDYYFENGFLPKELSVLDPKQKCGICDNCCGNTSGVLVDISEDLITYIKLLPHTRGFGMTRTLDIGKNLGHKDYVRILLNTLTKYSFVESYHHKWGDLPNQQGFLYRKINFGSDVINKIIRIPENIAKLLTKTLHYGSSKFVTARSNVAKLHSVLAQHIMNDKVLANVSKSNPKSIEELWFIDGVSTEFIGKYAQDFLDCLKK